MACRFQPRAEVILPASLPHGGFIPSTECGTTPKETAGESRVQDVKALHEEIDKLTKELATGQPTDESQKKHAATISGWWDKVTGWFRKK
ncbi:MAG: hypothetical protein HQ518_00015 [Rhodopirellula sp.]|nr:hypothetical protein [Rhodopirellula sp.]